MHGWLAAGIPLLLGVVFIGVGIGGLRRARVLRREGVRAPGVIVRLDTSSGENGTLYHPVAQWTTHDGRLAEWRSPLGKNAILNFRPGTPVTVVYAPDDPRRALIDGYGGGSYALFAVIGAVAVAAGGLVLWFTL